MTVARQDLESAIFGAVEELLDAMDAEFEEDLTAELLLVADLDFASIDFVQLIVAIEDRLGQKVGFQDMLMQDGKYVEDLSIGQVVDYTEQRINGAAEASVAAPQVAAPQELVHSGQTVSEQDVSRFLTLIKPRRIASGGQLKKNKRAVFILSPPRSGSTLLRVMMAGNPALFAPPELHLLSYATMDERLADLADSEQLLEGAMRALMQSRDWSLDEARQLVEQCQAEGMSTSEFYGLIQENLGSRLLVDKTPTYAFSTDILQQAEACFEDALYIHLLRHPCGMIRSYEESDLSRMMPLLMKSSEFSSAAVAEMIWLISNRNIMEFGKTVPQERWMPLSYENIVNDPEAQMRQLCDFLEVPYHQDMIHPYKDNQARMTDGVDKSAKMSGDLKFHLHSQIDPAAASRWRQFRSEDMLGGMTQDLVGILDQEAARIRVA